MAKENTQALDREILENKGKYLNFAVDLIMENPNNTALFLRIADLVSNEAMTAIRRRLKLEEVRQ